MTDSLLADDYAGARLDWVLAEHRRLFGEPVPPGTNRVLVGHRTPAIMVVGEAVGGRAFPEGGALVIAPMARPGFALLGILQLAPWRAAASTTAGEPGWQPRGRAPPRCPHRNAGRTS